MSFDSIILVVLRARSTSLGYGESGGFPMEAIHPYTCG